MIIVKEIGGYIELEHYTGKMLHEGAIALNCGRNALAYLIKARKIKKIALPYFLCDSVINICKQYDVEVSYYHIGENFLPQKVELMEDEWLYLVDFYGQLSKDDIRRICDTYQRVIVDYAQAYFEMPLEGVDSLYTCRKFFGVADGAFLYTNARLTEELPQDESFERMHFLLGRYERTASEFYSEFVENNMQFDSAKIMRMSKLTENLLKAINYEQVKDARTSNFDYLANRLGQVNLLQLKCAQGAFAYPLLLQNGAEVRKQLIARKIYIPTLWPNVLESMPKTVCEYKLSQNILPLPCDQRYNKADMEYICSAVFESMD